MSRYNGMHGMFTGFLIGGVVGSVIAMLYAPMNGKKLRKKIADKTNDVLEDVNGYIETGRDKADEIIRMGRKTAETIIQEAKNLVS
jgi:gas vesicle protein